MDTYFSSKKCVDRLFESYLKFGKLIIAVDFDSTLYDFYNEGSKHNMVLDVIKQSYDDGHYIVVFTSSRVDRHDFIKNFIYEKRNVIVHSINKNPIDLPYGNDGSKIFYNILLDDRAGLLQSYNILKRTLTKIKRHKNKK